jgi:hypothetical protein
MHLSLALGIFMKRILLTVTILLLLPAAGMAADEPEQRPYVRTDSLELPGLTAGCHICEWRPRLNQRPAEERCGLDETGNAQVGLFECGFSEDCRRVCNFIRCGTL